MDTKQASLYLALVCLQTVLVHAVPDWMPPEILDMAKEDKIRCMSEHGTTQEQINDVEKGTIPNDPSITCYMYCLLEAFSLVDDEGNLDEDMLMGVLPDNFQELANSILKTCLPTHGSDNCDKIYNLAKCIQSSAPDIWFMI
ncbi:PREDICTED: general odorant-binding protein 69a-like [Eufriesea mexicana]|uniref:general odorant-binding protein 69a-like n=1 Tax=Eufriesea mexicana TaxID=516756 RepID=UPI00083C5941|nr:PREDICTED: general odorant-binding protein 69a-like [Eufriesea mexicana]XP_017756389.1 PREDICTED: general odorant-binding protein 69a-like [Eufriesea mexicana]